MYKIIALRKTGREEIESFDDLDEARRMVMEYQLAFGNLFEVVIQYPSAG